MQIRASKRKMNETSNFPVYCKVSIVCLVKASTGVWEKELGVSNSALESPWDPLFPKAETRKNGNVI